MDSSYRPILKDSLYIRVQECVVVEVVPNTSIQKLCIHFNQIFEEDVDVSSVEQIQVENIVKEALGCNDLTILIQGLESTVTIFASRQLQSKIHVIGLKYSEDCELSVLTEIVSFLINTKIALVLHGNIFTIQSNYQNRGEELKGINKNGERENLFGKLLKPRREQNPPPAATSSSNPAAPDQSFTLILDACEGIGFSIASVLAAQKQNIIGTYRPGNVGIDILYDEIRSLNNAIQLLCLPLDTYNPESFSQLATAIKDSKIQISTVIYSFAKDTYRKPIHPIQINSHINLFEALDSLGLLISSTHPVNHIIITSDNSIRPFSSVEVMIDYVSNNMELAFARYLTKTSLQNRVVTIAAGSIETDRCRKLLFQEALEKQTIQSVLRQFPKSIIVENKEIANIIGFICQHFPYFHDNVIAICCGMHLQYQLLPDPTPKELPLSLIDTHFLFEKDAFAKRNPQSSQYYEIQPTQKRKINFGTAMNRLIPEVVMKYLPSWIQYEDSAYQYMIGMEEFRQLLVESTAFMINQVIAVNSYYAAIAILSNIYQKILVLGEPSTSSVSSEDLKMISTFSGGSFIIDGEDEGADCIFYFAHPDSTIQELRATATSYSSQQKPIIVFIHNKSQLFRVGDAPKSLTLTPLSPPDSMRRKGSKPPMIKSTKIGFVQNASFGSSLNCGVIYTEDYELKQFIQQQAYRHALSSPFQAAVVRKMASSVDLSKAASLIRLIQKMFSLHEGIPTVEADSIHLVTRASSGICCLGKILFQPKADRLGVDAPYYSSFRDDFESCDIALEPYYHDNRNPRNTLLTRVKRAKEDGCRGYIICNPHNPTGYVYPSKEINELCEWHYQEHLISVLSMLSSRMKNNDTDPQNKLSFSSTNSATKKKASIIPIESTDLSSTGVSNEEFHLIFDELLAHSIFVQKSRQEFHSAVHYIHQNPFIHILRGFGKDFGLSGFTTSMVLSSNTKVQQSLQSWQPILQPPDITLSILTSLLQSTNYGKVIFDENYQLLGHHMKQICELLEEERIDYHPPQAGIFIMINIGKLLKLKYYSNSNEFDLWKKIIDKIAINLSPGCLFGYRELGWFRICPIQSEDRYREGIQRLGEFIRKELED